MKTKYRILPQKTFIADLYLQFYHNEQWKFVPEEMQCYVLGDYLTLDDCPTKLPSHGKGNFWHGFHDQETFELIPFTKKYEDIQTYFDYVTKKRNEYLLKEEQKENAKIKYL